MNTGIKKLDIFLASINQGLIIDIFGARGTGKTQLSMQISVNLLKNKCGQITYHDTTGKFRPEKMAGIMKTNEIDISLLDRVKINRIINTAEQIHCIKNISLNNVLLLVIDNVTDLFSFEYRNKFNEKNISFMKYMHILSLTAIRHKTPIIVTNSISQVHKMEHEHLKNIIDIFTHVKIHLHKKHQTYYGVLTTPWLSQSFSYQITPNGILDK